jgi:multidrug efflux pump subunit AcrB
LFSLREAGAFRQNLRFRSGPIVLLAYRNGAPIRVRDVGQAVAEPVDRTVAAYQNNKDGVILAVFKQPGVNVIDVVDQIKAELPQLTARIPPAIKVENILDRTTTIRASVADVEFTLVLTICLVVMVILLFLRNFWATLIPSVIMRDARRELNSRLSGDGRGALGGVDLQRPQYS